ncbi:MAG: MerR family transcriptional regulator, partial [Paracoccaceae bacterium]
MQIGNDSVKGLRRVDLARATGCNLETIRYYENIGVMPDPPR